MRRPRWILMACMMMMMRSRHRYSILAWTFDRIGACGNVLVLECIMGACHSNIWNDE